MNTLQIERWRGEFGREYTDRNSLDRMQLDEPIAETTEWRVAN